MQACRIPSLADTSQEAVGFTNDIPMYYLFNKCSKKYSSSLCSHSIPWLGEGLSMQLPHLPIFRYPLPDDPYTNIPFKYHWMVLGGIMANGIWMASEWYLNGFFMILCIQCTVQWYWMVSKITVENTTESCWNTIECSNGTQWYSMVFNGIQWYTIGTFL